MITIVAAIGENNELAKDGNMLWNIPEDYDRFKKITKNHPVILGRKSVETMPDILAERTAITITRNLEYKHKLVQVAHSMEEAIKMAKSINPDFFVIGGGQIYHLGIPFVEKMELTRVYGKFPEANVFFPKFSENDWRLIHRENHAANERNAYNFSYETWIRI